MPNFLSFVFLRVRIGTLAEYCTLFFFFKLSGTLMLGADDSGKGEPSVVALISSYYC